MNTTCHRRLHITLLAPLLAICIKLPLAAQVSFTGTSYTQDFDTLPTQSSGTYTWTFTNNSTLPGWYSTEGSNSSARASSGSRDGGTLYSFGSNNNSDRALGLFYGASSGGYSTTAYLGLQLVNNTQTTIDSVTLTFDVEQWRYHTNHTAWAFSYLVTSSGGNQLTASGYTSDTRGNATSLHVTGDEGFASSGGLPGTGNAEGNKYSVSITLTNLDWKSGEYLWLRWGSNQTANAAGLGLDNIKLTASQIPEPGTSSLILGTAAVGIFLTAFLRRLKG